MSALRKVLVNMLYYYLLITNVMMFFLFISTFYFIFDGNKEARFSEPNVQRMLKWEVGFIGLFLLYSLLGTFLTIIFKRKQVEMEGWKFLMLVVLMCLFFILPSLVIMINAAGNFSGVY